MGFRFRKRVNFGPIKLNISKRGLSSVTFGGRGGSFNVPGPQCLGGRQGGNKVTVSAIGTGLSWDHTYPTNNGRQQPAYTEQTRQIEAAPLAPYAEFIATLNVVEENVRYIAVKPTKAQAVQLATYFELDTTGQNKSELVAAITEATIKGWGKDELEFACDELGFDKDGLCKTKSDYADCLSWDQGFDKGIALIVTTL